MSSLVTSELFAQPGRGDDVASLLLDILGESLQHDGCETIRILRDQDDPDHVIGLTQWTERRNFEDYLAAQQSIQPQRMSQQAPHSQRTPHSQTAAACPPGSGSPAQYGVWGGLVAAERLTLRREEHANLPLRPRV